MKRIRMILSVLAFMLVLFLLNACSTDRVIPIQVKCQSLTRPSIKTDGDLVKWTDRLEQSYEQCGNTIVYRSK